MVTRSYSLVANLTIPLWDGGVSRARTQQARAEVEQADAQMRTARLQVEEEVRRSWTDQQEAVERRRAAAANTLQAREALRIARVRYEAGLAQNVEVTDAQVALTQARTNEVNAAYDYLAAAANLNRSLGRYVGLSADTPGQAAVGPPTRPGRSGVPAPVTPALVGKP
ncbi:MAG: TolC family protein [Armatimonadetes bacterium]|nr:TolC family protein [Armatimonadota bacterium]